MRRILNKNKTKIIKKYNIKKFNFEKIFLKHFKKFNVKKLEDLHKTIPKKYLPNKLISKNNSQSQYIHKFIYKIDKGYDMKKDLKPSNFLKLFQKFIYYLAKFIFKDSLVYQAKPTLRVMFPNNIAVSEFHRDRNYNHPIEEVNIWLPLTKAKNSNALWTESKYNKEDYKPVNINYGKYLIFDSGLKHGNKINLEKKTRLSFDFRIIPYSVWKKIKKKNNIKSSYNQKIKFDVGEYYNLMHLKKNK